MTPTEISSVSEDKALQVGRLICAAAHVGQARLLVLRERQATTGGDQEVHILGTLADILSVLVGVSSQVMTR